MGSAVTRALGLLEYLVGRPEGVALTEIVEATGLPKSATHRTLVELIDAGHVRQEQLLGKYMLTLKFVSLGLRHVSSVELVDLAKPMLETLAVKAGALVRLSLVDGGQLVFVSRFQGARTGLRYDPDHGGTAHLASSASGHAWLSRLDIDRALSYVFTQGFETVGERGPDAPRTGDELRPLLEKARAEGYAEVENSYEIGTSAIASPILNRMGEVVGVVSIAGPTTVLDAARRQELVTPLLEVTAQLSALDLPATAAAIS